MKSDQLTPRQKAVIVVRGTPTNPDVGGWANYFAKFGCVGCGMDAKHFGGGLCAGCFEIVIGRMAYMFNADDVRNGGGDIQRIKNQR